MKVLGRKTIVNRDKEEKDANATVKTDRLSKF